MRHTQARVDGKRDREGLLLLALYNYLHISISRLCSLSPSMGPGLSGRP